MTPAQALRASSLFSQLTDAEIAVVSGILREREARSGEILIREGEEAYSLFILEEGMVDVLRNGEQGRPAARITELTPGAIFGEMSFAEHRHAGTHPPRSAGIVAHGAAKVLELRYDALEKLADANPVLGLKLYRALAASLNDKLKNTTDHLLPLIASARLAALGQMTANIAHELGNPLAVLRALADSIAQSLERRGEEGELRQWSEQIATTVTRIGKVISGLRIVSRDGAADPVTSVDPEAIVRDTLGFCEQRLRYLGVRIEVVPSPKPISARCRPVQLSQALLNLMNNSMDALAAVPDTEAGSRWIRVTVSAAENGSDPQAEIAVTDSGAGIPAEIAELIFRPFFTTKGVGVGTGLGLSISRKLAEDNGGCLRYEGATPHTRFVIRLPRA